MRRLVLLFALLLLAAPLGAKDSLGVFGQWGAFRDPQGPRCYAIAAAETRSTPGDFAPFASVGTWPVRQVRGQLHLRPSHRLVAAGASATLRIGNTTFRLTGGASDLWASDARADAAIMAAIRSAASMTLSARDARGRNFTDRYSLAGAATALDAASVGCAGRREVGRR